MTTIAFDPGAQLQLELARTLRDDGQPQLVEATLEHRDDGRLELHLTGDEGESYGSLILRSDFLHRALTAAIANDRRGREAAA